jgi:hypothetical protein
VDERRIDASEWSDAEVEARFGDMQRQLRRSSPWWVLHCRLVAACGWLRSSASLTAALGCLSAMAGGPYPPAQTDAPSAARRRSA